MWKIRFFLSDLPLPSIRSSSKSSANNNSFKKHWGHFPQVRYFVKTLVGEARLPSAVEMEKDRQVNPVFLEIGKQKINILVLRQVDLALQKKTILDFSGGDPIQEGSAWHARQILPQDGNSTGGFHWKQPPHSNVRVVMNISLYKTLEDSESEVPTRYPSCINREQQYYLVVTGKKN